MLKISSYILVWFEPQRGMGEKQWSHNQAHEISKSLDCPAQSNVIQQDPENLPMRKECAVLIQTQAHLF